MVYSTRLPWELEGRALDQGAGSSRRRLRVRGGRLEESEHFQPAAGATPLPKGRSILRPSSGDQVAWSWALPDDVWLLPGFVDAHTHLIGVGLAARKPDLSGARNKQEALDQLRAWLDARKSADDQPPLIAEGWDQSTWSEAVPFTREELDRIESKRPIACRRVCGHIAVLNSAALAAIATMGRAWPNVDSESGLAREELPLALPAIWPPTAEEHEQAVAIGQREAWRHGVTQVHEMGHPDSFRAFGRADAAGRLHLRVAHYLRDDALDAAAGAGLVAGTGSEWLRFSGIKFFLDGSLGGRSAALRAEVGYRDRDDRGLLLFTDRELERKLSLCRELGLPVALHAIGDAAIEQALGLLESVARQLGAWAPVAPRLEHAELLFPDLLARVEAQGVLLSMQPNFTARWQGSGELYEQALGPETTARMNPYHSAARSGRLAFGSDTMPLDPLLGLRGALGHPTSSERLDLLSAIDAYTRGGAAALARPFGWSDLGAGDLADFIGLRLPALANQAASASGGKSVGVDAPLAGAELLAQAEVVLTVIGGEVRYLAPGLLSEHDALLVAPFAVHR